MCHEGRRVRKGIGGRRLLFLRKEWTTAISIRGWSSGQQSCLGSGETLYTTLNKTLYEIDNVKIAKQKARSYATSQKIKDWALWRGRPPQMEEEPTSSVSVIRAINVRAPATLGNFAPTISRKEEKL
jgi:hypothetical protein